MDSSPSSIASIFESAFDLSRHAVGSWHGGIALAAIGFRVATFPLYAKAISRMVLRARLHAEHTAQFPRARYVKASLAEQTRVQSEFMTRMRNNGLSGSAMEGHGFFLLMSAPWTIGSLFTLGVMSRDDRLNPMFVRDSKFLWLDSLALPDATGILPIGLALVTLALLKNPTSMISASAPKGASISTGASNVANPSGILYTALKGIALASVPSFCFLPAACCEFLILNHLGIIISRSIVFRRSVFSKLVNPGRY